MKKLSLEELKVASFLTYFKGKERRFYGGDSGGADAYHTGCGVKPPPPP